MENHDIFALWRRILLRQNPRAIHDRPYNSFFDTLHSRENRKEIL